MAELSSQVKLVRIRMYCGGYDGYQASNFMPALSDFLRKFSETFRHRNWVAKLEVKYAADVRRDWTPKLLVDWLKGGDFHIITTHVHQGLPSWNAAEVVAELRRLALHPGFPSGPRLSCLVFLQHKFHYLLGLRQYVNPTLAVHLPLMTQTVDHRGTITLTSTVEAIDFDRPDINKFLDKHNEGKGWVIKLPFVTMREGMIFATTKSDVFNGLEIIAGKYGSRIPYAMIQPCLLNRKEYKVIVCNGRASHILPQKANGASARGVGFSESPHHGVLRFAEAMVLQLDHVCPGTMTDYLLRVDIMQKCTGSLIVNEVESFEAAFESANPTETNATNAFVRSFWDVLLSKFCDELI
jgi:hypothetical protein